MKEISLNILDIAENSAKAEAKLIEINITETEKTLTLTIKDDGCGMDEDTVKSVINPFYTTRTTRKVGLGIPLLKMACEQTGGNLDIQSSVADGQNEASGTLVSATFYKQHIDFTPLGDVVSTITTLIQGHSDIDFVYTHKTPDGDVTLDTRLLREVLEDVPLSSFEVLSWIKDDLDEQYSLI